ncbi:MAG: family 2 glycosyl transferase [bacterium P3]|nr:MAG: family 2 glycosyl transferase [bacterium P3]KWW38699.1 MAG: family 2 glycosyl transferase [bacterium F083]
MMISLVIPVYNRPDEIVELLQSIAEQRFRDFEVVVVEDGSSRPCKEAIAPFADCFKLQYFYKENSGPGPSRNYGVQHAEGDYVIVLDSDCILPPDYLSVVHRSLSQEPIDAFGGPDRAHESFTALQKAINYSMTSFLTTGGIRGGMKKVDKFHPRSFNMGVRTAVWRKAGGFSAMRYGEDVDFSIRLKEAGYRVVLISEAWVWHKRRNTLGSFFRQVYHFGQARICLYRKHPSTLKLMHLFPAAFAVGAVLLVLAAPFTRGWSLLPLALLALLLFLDSLRLNRNLKVAALSVVTAFTQQAGYGLGFLTECFRRQ